jgi:general secretion pathway protein H
MGKTRVKDSGVTLIEVLVVLVLIGISAGIVTYSLPSGRAARTVDQEAGLLAARLNLAAERSLIGGQHYRLDWTVAGYQFLQWQDDDWSTAMGAPLNADHRLAGGTAMTQGDGARRGSLQITPDLLPPSDGPATLRFEAGSNRQTVTFDGVTARAERSDL